MSDGWMGTGARSCRNGGPHRLTMERGTIRCVECKHEASALPPEVPHPMRSPVRPVAMAGAYGRPVGIDVAKRAAGDDS